MKIKIMTASVCLKTKFTLGGVIEGCSVDVCGMWRGGNGMFGVGGGWGEDTI